MRTLNKISMLIAFITIGLLVSCSQDSTNELTQELERSATLLETEFGHSMIDKVGEERAQEMLLEIENPSMRAPITYDGELCPGVVNTGDAIYRGYSNLANADFWYFSGTAGDVISIQVDRVNCNMDPVVILYDGYGDTVSLSILTAADDNNGTACAPSCFSYADPLISGYVLPNTGLYTVAIWDYIGGSCAMAPLTYNVTANGFSFDADGDGCDDCTDPHRNSNMDSTVMIDGCDSGVTNSFVTACSTMNDLIADCADTATNHGDFVSCVAHLTNQWKADGLITGKQKGKIQKCAAQSSIP
jgi:hypothetical protein